MNCHKPCQPNVGECLSERTIACAALQCGFGNHADNNGYNGLPVSSQFFTSQGATMATASRQYTVSNKNRRRNANTAAAGSKTTGIAGRSEERRVGKEC